MHLFISLSSSKRPCGWSPEEINPTTRPTSSWPLQHPPCPSPSHWHSQSLCGNRDGRALHGWIEMSPKTIPFWENCCGGVCVFRMSNMGSSELIKQVILVDGMWGRRDSGFLIGQACETFAQNRFMAKEKKKKTSPFMSWTLFSFATIPLCPLLYHLHCSCQRITSAFILLPRTDGLFESPSLLSILGLQWSAFAAAIFAHWLKGWRFFSPSLLLNIIDYKKVRREEEEEAEAT